MSDRLTTGLHAGEAATELPPADVIVAGGGMAGCMAALAAAREGADVLLIERFGSLGGNIGPGMFGGLYLHLALGFPRAMPQGVEGIPGEFLDCCGGYCDGQVGHDGLRDAEVASYVLLRMMRAAGVRLLLNSFVAAPVLQDHRVIGLTAETKSGRVTVRGHVVVDATGDADVAFRSGAPMDPDRSYMHPGLFFAVAGVDEAKYNAFMSREPSPEDAKALVDWYNERMQEERGLIHIRQTPLLPLYKRAWELGDYSFLGRIADLAVVAVDHGFYAPRDGILTAQVGLNALRHLDSGDAAQQSELEAGARQFIFQTAQFLRRSVPGCERSYLLVISPYFHYRGGRSATPEYALTVEDVKSGRRFDDVVFVVYGSETKDRAPEGNDFPYRQILPQRVDGLLVAGRAALIQPPVMRDRWKVLLMGQAAGVAAALCVGSGVSPRQLDVTALQRILARKYHAPLGNADRLRELALT